MRHSIGIDLGGTFIKGIAIAENGEILQEVQAATEAHRGHEAVIRRMAELVFDLKDRLRAESVVIGATVPGVLRGNSVVELLPNFPGPWKGVPIKEELERLISQSVAMLNDARAAAFGEYRFGAAQGYDDFVSIVLGTGVGGGIVHNGRLFLGSRGVAGEIGHQVVEPEGLPCGCGNFGCLETVASGAALASAGIRYIRQGITTSMRDLAQGDLNRVTPELVNRAAQLGDPAAVHILTKAASYVVRAIRNLIALLNPQAVVIGGGVAQSELFLDAIRSGLQEREILFPDNLGGVAIVKAQFDRLAGAMGAAAWALHQEQEHFVEQ